MKNPDIPPLSPSAQKIQTALNKAGFPNRVMEFTKSTRTAQEAADRVGCNLGQIVKSLIFRGSLSKKPILVLTSGLNRVDVQIISRYVGETISRADAEFVRSVTGYVIGGVPPLEHNTPMDTFIDEDLFRYKNLWAAAGSPQAVFNLTPQDLVKITQGKVCRIKENV